MTTITEDDTLLLKNKTGECFCSLKPEVKLRLERKGMKEIGKFEIEQRKVAGRKKLAGENKKRLRRIFRSMLFHFFHACLWFHRLGTKKAEPNHSFICFESF